MSPLAPSWTMRKNKGAGQPGSISCRLLVASARLPPPWVSRMAAHRTPVALHRQLEAGIYHFQFPHTTALYIQHALSQLASLKQFTQAAGRCTCPSVGPRLHFGTTTFLVQLFVVGLSSTSLLPLVPVA